MSRAQGGAARVVILGGCFGGLEFDLRMLAERADKDHARAVIPSRKGLGGSAAP